MRIAVLIVGLLGVVGPGFLGYKWMADFYTVKDEMAFERQRLKGVLAKGFTLPPELREGLVEFDARARCWPFLFTAVGLGLFGALLALDGRRFSPAALFGTAALGPALFNPWTLVFNSGLVLAAGLALLIKPPRARAPVAN